MKSRLVEDRRGVVAVEFALLVPLFALMIMSQVWLTVNALGVMNKTVEICQNVELALFEYDPNILLSCSVERDPTMEWPF